MFASWLALLFVASWYDDVLFIASKGECSSFFNLECPGFLDSPIVFIMATLLWMLSCAAIILLETITPIFSRGGHALNKPFESARHDRAASRGTQANENEYAGIADFVALRTRCSKCLYALTLLVFAIGVFILQIYVPLTEPKPSWALVPDKRVVYTLATAWAFFCWVIVVANSAWVILASSTAVFWTVYKKARDRSVFILPAGSSLEAYFSALNRLGLLTALSLTFVGMVLALLTIKLYKENYAVMMLVSIALLAPFVFFMIPNLVTRSAIKRGQDIFRKMSAAFVESFLRDAKLNFQYSATSRSVPERALLEFLVWERILARAEGASTMLLNLRTVVWAGLITSVQLAAMSKLAYQIHQLVSIPH